VRLWSELPPWERRAELAKHHPDLTEAALIADGLNVPQLAPLIRAQESNEDKVMPCLRYFGDEGHPQPAERGRYGPMINGKGGRQSPPWGRLPRLKDQSEPQQADDLVGGLPYLKADYEAAGKLHAARKMTVEGIRTRRGFSQKRAHRIYRQFDKGAVLYDEHGLRPAAGYRWDPAGREMDPPEYKLIRD
jgi:hypothetical protein